MPCTWNSSLRIEHVWHRAGQSAASARVPSPRGRSRPHLRLRRPLQDVMYCVCPVPCLRPRRQTERISRLLWRPRAPNSIACATRKWRASGRSPTPRRACPSSRPRFPRCSVCWKCRMKHWPGCSSRPVGAVAPPAAVPVPRRATVRELHLPLALQSPRQVVQSRRATRLHNQTWALLKGTRQTSPRAPLKRGPPAGRARRQHQAMGPRRQGAKGQQRQCRAYRLRAARIARASPTSHRQRRRHNVVPDPSRRPTRKRALKSGLLKPRVQRLHGRPARRGLSGRRSPAHQLPARAVHLPRHSRPVVVRLRHNLQPPPRPKPSQRRAQHRPGLPLPAPRRQATVQARTKHKRRRRRHVALHPLAAAQPRCTCNPGRLRPHGLTRTGIPRPSRARARPLPWRPQLMQHRGLMPTSGPSSSSSSCWWPGSCSSCSGGVPG